jgi:hypothetical protein
MCIWMNLCKKMLKRAIVVLSAFADLLTEVVVMKVLLGGMHLQIQPTTKTNIRAFEKPCKIYIICDFAYLIFAELDLT